MDVVFETGVQLMQMSFSYSIDVVEVRAMSAKLVSEVF